MLKVPISQWYNATHNWQNNTGETHIKTASMKLYVNIWLSSWEQAFKAGMERRHNLDLKFFRYAVLLSSGLHRDPGLTALWFDNTELRVGVDRKASLAAKEVICKRSPSWSLPDKTSFLIAHNPQRKKQLSSTAVNGMQANLCCLQ